MEIRFNQHTLSKEELKKHQDFTAILQQKKRLDRARIHRQRWRYGLSVSLILLIALFYAYRQSLPTTPSPLAPAEPTEVVQPPVKETALPSADSLTVNRPKAVEAPTSPPEQTEKKTTTPLTEHVAEAEEDLEAPKASANHTQPVTSYTYTEAQPANGYPALYAYFSEALIYPEVALLEQQEGTVVISFLIGPDGRPTAIEVLSSISEALDAEAIRLVQEMPDWMPAQVNGQAISSRKSMPINFKIER